MLHGVNSFPAKYLRDARSPTDGSSAIKMLFPASSVTIEERVSKSTELSRHLFNGFAPFSDTLL